MARCLLGLGSNLGDRRSMLRQATGRVELLRGCHLVAQSRWHETTPIGGPDGQGTFLNGALLLDCTIPASELASELQEIELQLGRSRAIRWDSRAIDIDLLLFGAEVIESPNLSVPHPRMSFRKFVLEPAAEIAGFMIDPSSGWTLSGLLRYLQNAPRYVAVASSDAAIAVWLAEGLSQKLGCPRLEEVFPVGEVVGDSDVSATVEFSQWAIARLCSSRWENNKELARRLVSGTERLHEKVPPVVSAFWYGEDAADVPLQAASSCVPTERGKSLEKNPSTKASILHPALVIAVEPTSKENFLEKIKKKKEKKNPSIFPDYYESLFHAPLKRRGHGPMACIRSEDPTVVLQEATAAIRSVWPEL